MRGVLGIAAYTHPRHQLKLTKAIAFACSDGLWVFSPGASAILIGPARSSRQSKIKTDNQMTFVSIVI